MPSFSKIVKLTSTNPFVVSRNFLLAKIGYETYFANKTSEKFLISTNRQETLKFVAVAAELRTPFFMAIFWESPLQRYIGVQNFIIITNRSQFDFEWLYLTK